MNEALAGAGGHYARKQLASASRLIAWSHRQRFATALDLASRLPAGRVLDYGCGDGSFLAMLKAAPNGPRDAVGAELTAELVDDCRRRLGGSGTAGLDFVLVDDLAAPRHRCAYDLVVCMEVLEHVVAVEQVLDLLRGLVTPGGHLLVSVPVEIGLPLLVKQTVRTVAGWRGIGDYPGTTPYTWGELLRSLTAGAAPHVARVTHHGADGAGRPFHDHKGFNWKALGMQLAARFDVVSVTGSPVRWLPPSLASQVWFVCRAAT